MAVHHAAALAKELHALQDMIAKAVMTSLSTCPDIVAMRKELLVATRHSLAIPSLRSCARFALGRSQHAGSAAPRMVCLCTWSD